MAKQRTPRLVGVLAAAGLGVGLALSGCSPAAEQPAPTTSAAPETGGELRIQFTGSPISLNPALAASGGSTVYTNLTYDPLIYLDAEGKLVPDLAESWEFVSDDNTVLELKLREGVSFHGGGELDATAAKASMDYFLGAGGQMVRQVGPIDEIEVVDATTLRIHYGTPFPDAPWTLTQYFQLGSIIGPDGLADPESLLTSSDGTGQYVYNADESVVDANYVYDRNETYWNPDAQMFDRVSVQVITDPNAVVAAISTGQVDFSTGSVLTTDAARSAGLAVLGAPYYIWAIQILDRNGELNPALGDVRVREAIQLGLDRQTIADAVVGEFGEVNGQIVHEGAVGYVPGLGEDYNVDAAKQLLADAGYADGLTIRLATTTAMDPQSIIAQAMAASLAEVGITVELDVEANGLPRLLERSEAKEFEAMLLPIQGARHVGQSSQTLASRPNLNPWQVKDAEIDELYAKTLVSNEADAPAVHRALNERWNELAWVIPVYSDQRLFYAVDTLENVSVSSGNPNPVPIGPAPEYSWKISR
ncbi:MAG TPA: ABC transporter substrate-binding protein [Microbacteriaceae bacterium]|nr:ABC transporter substrate-binding protein [Microbacteriaceae bacterium]